MARTEKLKPILTGNNVSDFIMPTFGEFPSEYHQAYEVLKKRGARRKSRSVRGNLRISMKMKIYKNFLQPSKIIIVTILLKLKKSNPLLHAAI
jgi:hypothetical protein